MLSERTRLINEDIREEFREIRRDVLSYVNRNPRDITRSDVAKRVRTSVERRTDVLFDTLLNYLMDDARASLVRESVQIRNDFFARDFRKRMRDGEGSHSLDGFDGSWTRDPRAWAGAAAAGGIALSGVAGSATMVSNPLPMIVSLLAAAVASTVAYKVARHVTNGPFRHSLERDLTDYFRKAEQEITVCFGKVESDFLAAFDEFLKSARDAPEEGE